jgi:hypothetical protein
MHLDMAQMMLPLLAALACDTIEGPPGLSSLDCCQGTELLVVITESAEASEHGKEAGGGLGPPPVCD